MIRERLLRKAGNANIVAVWLKGLRNVYDAYDVAQWLGYWSRNDNGRRNLDDHLDEYLIYGGISADEYRILAIFDGERLEDTCLSTSLLSGRAEIPSGFLRTGLGETVVQKLENEIYQRTGVCGESDQLLRLVTCLTV